MDWRPLLDLLLLALSDPQIIASTLVLYFIRQTYRDNRDWMIFDLVGIIALSAFVLIMDRGIVGEFREVWRHLPAICLALSTALVWYFIIDIAVQIWQRARHL